MHAKAGSTCKLSVIAIALLSLLCTSQEKKMQKKCAEAKDKIEVFERDFSGLAKHDLQAAQFKLSKFMADSLPLLPSCEQIDREKLNRMKEYLKCRNDIQQFVQFADSLLSKHEDGWVGSLTENGPKPLIGEATLDKDFYQKLISFKMEFLRARKCRQNWNQIRLLMDNSQFKEARVMLIKSKRCFESDSYSSILQEINFELSKPPYVSLSDIYENCDKYSGRQIYTSFTVNMVTSCVDGPCVITAEMGSSIDVFLPKKYMQNRGDLEKRNFDAIARVKPDIFGECDVWVNTLIPK